MRGRCVVAFGGVCLLASGSLGAQMVVDSFQVGTFQYSGAPTNIGVTFNAGSPITGVGLRGGFRAVAGDIGGGTFPWSLDLAATVTAPGGESFQWGPNINGDRTIADYPFSDGSGAGLSGNAGNGLYNFAFFDSFGGTGSLAEITNATVYATTTVDDVFFNYESNPDPSTSWDRPFFIDAVSGLGPVSYDVLEFTVSDSGVYDFTSVLSNGGDHFTFLYEGAFDDTQPLDNLLDYGLGNGFGPFGTPRGTSEISALLLEGETYYWVTSVWDRFDAFVPSDNTIVGPGTINVIPAPGAAGLLALAGVAGTRRRR